MSEIQVEIEKTQDKQSKNGQVRTEEFVVSGDQVVTKIKELFHQGNIRRLSLYTESGRALVKIPLTIGAVGLVVGIFFAPVLVAIGALVGIFTKVRVAVERVDQDDASD